MVLLPTPAPPALGYGVTKRLPLDPQSLLAALMQLIPGRPETADTAAAAHLAGGFAAGV